MIIFVKHFSKPIFHFYGDMMNKRKKRAKVKMDFSNDSILIDLGFEIIKEVNGEENDK